MRRLAKERSAFSRRALLIGLGQGAVFAGIAARLYNLQVTQHSKYAMLAEQNSISERLVAPERGLITDRFGTILAGNQQHWRALFMQALAPEPQRLLVPGSTVCLESGWRIGAEMQPLHTASWRRPADLFEAVADAALVAGSLIVRTVRPGDRIRPLGLQGHRKLQDVLVDRKVPIRTRRTCPVVEVNGEVFWVPGIVRSSHALVTPSTRATLRLTAEEPTIAGQ